MSWDSSDVIAGNEITSAIYNNLRADVLKVWADLIPVGVIFEWSGPIENVPDTFLVCDGSAVSRNTYSDLFAAIGIVNGAGNGTTTFNLPNTTNRFSVGAGDDYSVGTVGGNKDITLTEAQMPQHNHTCQDDDNDHEHNIRIFDEGAENTHQHGIPVTTISVQTGSTTIYYPSGEDWDIEGDYFPTGGERNSVWEEPGHIHNFSVSQDEEDPYIVSPKHNHVISNKGGGESHSNIPPYSATYKIIKAFKDD